MVPAFKGAAFIIDIAQPHSKSLTAYLYHYNEILINIFIGIKVTNLDLQRRHIEINLNL